MRYMPSIESTPGTPSAPTIRLSRATSSNETRLPTAMPTISASMCAPPSRSSDADLALQPRGDCTGRSRHSGGQISSTSARISAPSAARGRRRDRTRGRTEIHVADGRIEGGGHCACSFSRRERPQATRIGVADGEPIAIAEEVERGGPGRRLGVGHAPVDVREVGAEHQPVGAERVNGRAVERPDVAERERLGASRSRTRES